MFVSCCAPAALRVHPTRSRIIPQADNCKNIPIYHTHHTPTCSIRNTLRSNRKYISLWFFFFFFGFFSNHLTRSLSLRTCSLCRGKIPLLSFTFLQLSLRFIASVVLIFCIRFTISYSFLADFEALKSIFFIALCTTLWSSLKAFPQFLYNNIYVQKPKLPSTSQDSHATPPEIRTSTAPVIPCKR